MTRPLIEFFKTHGWCQLEIAQDDNGKSVLVRSEQAASFCLFGAMAVCDLPYADTAARLGFADHGELILWNDTPGRTKEEVMQRIEEAGL